MYILKSDDKYVRWDQKGVSVTTNMSQATKWKDDSIDKVIDTLKHNRILKGTKLKKILVENGKQLTDRKIEKRAEKPKTVSSDYELNESVQSLFEFVKWMKERRAYLYDQVHDCDLEIVDLNHAIEFKTLNVVEGYKLYKQLHEVSVKRREYKNEIQQIDFIMNTPINETRLDNLQKSLDKVSEKVYVPRIRPELFEGVA